MVKSAGDAGKKCSWNEHGRENECDADDRPRYFAHRLQRRFARRHSFLDVALDCFDHDNRIIHHETDREDEAEEGERVDRESEQRKQDESANQRDRHRAEWDERGAPALEKNKNDEHDERERFEQRFHYFPHAFSDRECLIERNRIIDVRWKALLRVRH